MHPYLMKLGVHPDVQAFFRPYYNVDARANLTFDYGDDCEIYGLAWHRVPASQNLWVAGGCQLPLVRRALICSSAMEAISWLNYHYAMIGDIEQLCFVATGSSLPPAKLGRLSEMFNGKRCSTVFSNDLLGKVCDLKTAAAIRSQPIHITFGDNCVGVEFRAVRYMLDTEQFSVTAFEKLAAFRFSVPTLKPKGALTWLDRLTTAAFNL